MRKGSYRGSWQVKKVVILNNMGFPYDYYDKIGMLQSIKQTSDQGIFEFLWNRSCRTSLFRTLRRFFEKRTEAHVNVLKLIYDKLLS